MFAKFSILLFFISELIILVSGSYLSIDFFDFRDGVPYCEKDYQKLFGVKCAYCTRFISGKVLQVSI